MRSFFAPALVALTLMSSPGFAVEPKAMVDLRNAVMWSIGAHLNQIIAKVAGDAKTVAATPPQSGLHRTS